MKAVEIIVSLNRRDSFPSALFTIDLEGRVIAHWWRRAVLAAALRRLLFMSDQLF